MENTQQEAPVEGIVTSATCSKCKAVIFEEEIITTTIQGKPAMYRKVTGSYIQFLDEDGLSIGPYWPVCESCQSNPIQKPEAQEAYLKLITKEL
jgi:hypothetical protein